MYQYANCEKDLIFSNFFQALGFFRETDQRFIFPLFCGRYILRVLNKRFFHGFICELRYRLNVFIYNYRMLAHGPIKMCGCAFCRPDQKYKIIITQHMLKWHLFSSLLFAQWSTNARVIIPTTMECSAPKASQNELFVVCQNCIW
jgi:hypothetical protein